MRRNNKSRFVKKDVDSIVSLAIENEQYASFIKKISIYLSHINKPDAIPKPVFMVGDHPDDSMCDIVMKQLEMLSSVCVK